MTAAAKRTAHSGAVVQMDDLRRRDTDERRQTRQAMAAFADAIVDALPALIEAARVVSESGDWECREPVPRVGRRGGVQELEPCGRCLGCRMTAAQEHLAEVEL